MREQGIITKIISGKIVEVAFKRSDACAKCRLCHDVAEGMTAIEAIDAIGARIDDIVEIEIPSEEVVKSSLLIFLMPIFFLIGGYLVSAALMRAMGIAEAFEAISVVAALAAFAASFYVVRWYDKRVEQKAALRAKIIKIL